MGPGWAHGRWHGLNRRREGGRAYNELNLQVAETGVSGRPEASYGMYVMVSSEKFSESSSVGTASDPPWALKL